MSRCVFCWNSLAIATPKTALRTIKRHPLWTDLSSAGAVLPQHIVQLPRSLAGNVSRQVAEGKGRVSNLLEALREPLKLDRKKAEWLAEQLLEAGEKGILVPANIVLDAYTRGKARWGLLRLLCGFCGCGGI
jgi:hypothetical protein